MKLTPQEMHKNCVTEGRTPGNSSVAQPEISNSFYVSGCAKLDSLGANRGIDAIHHTLEQFVHFAGG